MVLEANFTFIFPLDLRISLPFVDHPTFISGLYRLFQPHGAVRTSFRVVESYRSDSRRERGGVSFFTLQSNSHTHRSVEET